MKEGRKEREREEKKKEKEGTDVEEERREPSPQSQYWQSGSEGRKAWWHKPVIPSSQEAEAKAKFKASLDDKVSSGQPGQLSQTLSQNKIK